jgi:hypothetical protein
MAQEDLRVAVAAGGVESRRYARASAATSRPDRPLRRSGTDMEVAGPRDAPDAYMSENKAPAAQFSVQGLKHLILNSFPKDAASVVTSGESL